jgi:hypothetical protein
LSTSGCGVVGSCSLEEGSNGWLKFDGLEAIYSRVAWRRDTFAGIEFDTQLHRAIVERMVTSSPAFGQESCDLGSVAMRMKTLARDEDSVPVAMELLSLSVAAARPLQQRHS